MKNKRLFVIILFFYFIESIISQNLNYEIIKRYNTDSLDLGQKLNNELLFSKLVNIGDVDGDGVDELAFGAYGEPSGIFDAGTESGGGVVFICFLNTQGLVRKVVPISEWINGFNEDYINSTTHKFSDHKTSEETKNVLNFDGIDDYVDANDLAFHLAGKDNFTIEFWMRAGSQPEIRTSLFSINKPFPGDNEFLMVLGETFNPGDQKLNIYDQHNPNGKFVLQSPEDITGDCHHIAYVKKGNVGEAFIDGVSIGTHNIYYSITSNHRVSFGQDYDGINASEFYKGNLWNIAIWNTARSNLEIRRDAQYHVKGFEDGLIAYYDANQGDVANQDTCSRYPYCYGQNNSQEIELKDLTSNQLDLPLRNFALDGDSSNWVRGKCHFIEGAQFGNTVVGIGDIDGDGVPDIAVGAPNDILDEKDIRDYRLRPGAVYILMLNNDGTVKKHQRIGEGVGGLTDWSSYGRFGESISLIGDINRDGNSDLAISALYYNDGLSGAIYFIKLDTNGAIKSFSKILPKGEYFKNKEDYSFGRDVVNMGDVNGDGNFDILVSDDGLQTWLLFLDQNQQVIGSKVYDVERDSVFFNVFAGGDSSINRLNSNHVSISAIPDINHDGIKELLLMGEKVGGKIQAGVFIIDTIGEIKTFSLVDNELLPNLLWRNISFLGDIINDDYPEIAVCDNHDIGGNELIILSVKPEKCLNDCVWPGDANNDGIVNSRDILQIGCSFWQTSDKKRIMALTSWAEQHCDRWDAEINKVNAKHSDCDGNGVVNFLDAPVVAQNYSKVSLKMDETVLTDPFGPPLYIIPNKDTVTTSDSISYSITFGSLENRAENIYGVSMKLQHDVVELFGSGNTASFSGSWLGTKNVDMIATGFPLEDGIDIGMSRTDQVNRTGYGYLATVDVVTPDNLVEINKDLVWEMTDLTIVSYEGDTIYPNVIFGDPVVIMNREELDVNILEKGLKVYPNPNSGIFNIDSRLELDGIRIMDLSGRTIKDFHTPSQHEVLNLSGFEKGVYLIEFQSGNLTAYERVFMR